MRFTALLLAALAPAISGARAAEPIRIEADLREAPRGLIHASLRIPVQPGPLTLCYPRWIPGEHAPSGPVIDLAGVKLFARGKLLPWRRDPENMFAIRLEIPAGTDALDVRLDYLGPTDESSGLSEGPSTSPQLAVLSWNLVALYPAGIPAGQILCEPSIVLPGGWKYGTSLTPVSDKGVRVRFKPVSLEMLIDQPVLAGAHFLHLELTPGGSPEHVLDCAADSEAALEISPEQTKSFRALPPECAALLGARFYQTYHFLLALSDRTGYAGLEHHQCSDNRAPERSLIEDEGFLTFADLLPHEYFHSWNGKHRRPLDLLSPDYQKAMHTDLLWVYEGLTEYYGNVLAARAGLRSPEEYRERLAHTAGLMLNQKGREWRSLQDTADTAQLLYYAGRAWSSRRRGADYYDEGELLWLEADMLIRRLSGGSRSLDDFVRAFFGDGRTDRIRPDKVPGAAPSVSPYRAEDVYAALNAVAPHDWKGFFTERLDRVGSPPPLAGIVGAGWELAFDHTQNRFVVANEKTDKRIDLRYSLGLTMDADTQAIGDVVPGSPADFAELGPGMKVIGVNGRKFSEDVLRDALLASPVRPIDLLVENAEFISSHRLAYSGGLRYPHLVRNGKVPDLLEAIIRPRAR